MKDEDRSKADLIEELTLLRGKIQSLEAVQAKYTALKEKIRRLGALVDDPLISAPPTSPREHKGHNATVMVVDDNDAFRHYLVNALTRNGYRVVAAGNAGEAMAALADSPASIDLLLTDVVMPDGSGNTLSRDIKERHPDIKVLFMSGYSDELLVHSDVQEVMEGEDSFLQKPFLTEELLEMLQQKLCGEM